MKYAFLVLLLAFSPLTYGQPPKSKAGATPVKKSASKPKSSVAVAKPKAKPTPVLSEKEQYEKASAYELATDRVAALEKFLVAFPQSENQPAAVDLLASSRVLIAEEKLLSGDADGAVSLLKLVVAEAPVPVPNELFESIARIPTTLFFQGQRSAALELATTIENKVEGDVSQLIAIANFHLATENGSEAMRVAAKAAAKDPSSPAVHRALALAHRINFDLDLSADEYAKSLELEPDSVASKRGLAEMKRALGKSAEAVTLYRELIAKNENDLPSQTGLILALFDVGNRTDAEAEMTRSLEKTPGNVILLAGAAYWYASKGLGDKAVELAEKAVAKEPRYVWSHIALGRGLIAKGKPVEAEHVLVKARAFGNFPTLEYEIASARTAAGFFRDAVEDLQKQFKITSSGNVRTNLGGRVMREEKSIADLVAFERKASIFTPATDSAENAEILKSLLTLDQKLQSPTLDETEVSAAADAFASGPDKMRIHRQLYAAGLLLQKRVAIDKVLDLSKAATISSDSALDVANPRSAVMASELYEARAAAFRKNEFLLVPEIPVQTLSAILRGRIEEIAGWALYQQSNFPAAIIRLRRAKSVLPDKSAWWRSSVWRLGAALAANGNDAEALSAYVESYKTDKPDFAKYAIVEALYKKVNGSTEGLEEKLGPERVAASPAAPTTEPAAAQVQDPVAPKTDAPATGVPIADTPVIETSKPVEETPKTIEPKAAPDIETGLRQTLSQPIGEKKETKVEPVPKNDAPPKTDPPAEDKQETKVEPDAKTEVPKRTDPPVEEKQETNVEPDPEAEPLKKIDPPVGKQEIRVEPDPKTEAPKKIDPPVEEEQETKVEPDPKTEAPKKIDPPVEEKQETKVEPPKTDPPPPRIDRTVEEREEPKGEPDPSDPGKPKPDVPDPQTETTSAMVVTQTPSLKAANKSGPAKAATKTSSQKTESGVAKVDATKLLFEPIIITIPSPTAASRPAAEASGSERQRLIDGQEAKSEASPPCKVSVSQESISLINGGGTVGLLVTVHPPGDIKKLKGISGSPNDIEVTLEPEISGMPDRRFFVIKSTSSTLGTYQLTFTTPCGKKDVLITVR